MAREHKICPMRHENGNCLPAGGFCTAVNDPICEALHSAYDTGFRAGVMHVEDVKKTKSRIKFFSCEENLSQYTDSMLFDSGKDIASMVFEGDDGDISVDLRISGEVRVFYKGIPYDRASDFPEELLALIREKPMEWDNEKDVEICSNNWFEYIYHSDAYGDDDIMCEDDISNMSVEELKSEMQELCEEIADGEYE